MLLYEALKFQSDPIPKSKRIVKQIFITLIMYASGKDAISMREPANKIAF